MVSMGAVMAWVRVLVGFAILAIAYMCFSPILDFLISYLTLMGGNAATIASWINVIVYKVVPIGISVSMVIYGILESTRSEDGSSWR